MVCRNFASRLSRDFRLRMRTVVKIELIDGALYNRPVDGARELELAVWERGRGVRDMSSPNSFK